MAAACTDDCSSRQVGSRQVALALCRSRPRTVPKDASIANLSQGAGDAAACLVVAVVDQRRTHRMHGSHSRWHDAL